jgi:ABC-type multidrug transport system fused ATPase/permease subunit
MMIPRYRSQDALDRRGSIGALVTIFGRFFRFLLPYWDKLLLVLLVGQANAFIWLIPPLLSIRIIDEVFPQRNWTLGVHIVLASLAVEIFGLYLNLVTGYVQEWLAMFVTYRIQFGFLRHLQRLSLSFLRTRPAGEHLLRATDDPGETSDLILRTIPDLVVPFQTLAANVAIIAVIKPQLALLALAYVIPFATIQHLFTGWIRNRTKSLMAREQEHQGRFVELIHAFKTTRALNREATERRKLLTTWARVRRAQWRIWWLDFFREGALEHLQFLIFLIALPLLTIHWVIGGQMTMGEYVAAGWIISRFVEPVEMIVEWFQGTRLQLVQGERMLDTLDVEPDVEDDEHAEALPSRIDGRITFDGVSYAYPGGPQVLRDIKLTIEPGETLAIVGPSGAGKSTLLGLVCRFHRPTKGRVLLDGYDINRVKRSSLMRHVGVCLQDTLLLMGTVGENIWYGGVDPSRAEIEEAARLAGVHDFVVDLPGGYETMLGEDGNLSGGQAQRIGLARAIVRDPRVLLLDEVTNNLDPVLHREIVQSLRGVSRGRTVLMVSHSLLDIQDADRICVLNERGEVSQLGRHDELMAAAGKYRQMWSDDRPRLDHEGG